MVLSLLGRFELGMSWLRTVKFRGHLTVSFWESVGEVNSESNRTWRITRRDIWKFLGEDV